MTRTTNARLAGLMFLLYIATAFPAMVLFEQASSGERIAARLASIARNAPTVRLTIVLTVIGIFVALTLAMALFALTRDEDHDLAVLALCCRAGEGVIAAIPTLAMLGVLSIASGATGPDDWAANAIGALLLKVRVWSTTVSATVFAVGSAVYAYLFLRARSIPVPLAWLGLIASIVIAVALPAQLVGVLKGVIVDLYMWLPMLLFEVVLALWLLIKGVRASSVSPRLS